MIASFKNCEEYKNFILLANCYNIDKPSLFLKLKSEEKED